MVPSIVVLCSRRSNSRDPPPLPHAAPHVARLVIADRATPTIQNCPICLGRGAMAHLRRGWRIATEVVRSTDGCLLLDTGRRCGGLLSPLSLTVPCREFLCVPFAGPIQPILPIATSWSCCKPRDGATLSHAPRTDCAGGGDHKPPRSPVATENPIRAGADAAMGYLGAGMIDLLKLLGGFLVGLFRSQAAREAEMAFLRQQLLVLKRSAPARLRLRNADRLIFVWLYRLFPSLL
jgi:hypothetical protein